MDGMGRYLHSLVDRRGSSYAFCGTSLVLRLLHSQRTPVREVGQPHGRPGAFGPTVDSTEPISTRLWGALNRSAVCGDLTLWGSVIGSGRDYSPENSDYVWNAGRHESGKTRRE